LMSSGENLCIIEATSSVVLNLFSGVAVLACTRLIIVVLLVGSFPFWDCSEWPGT